MKDETYNGWTNYETWRVNMEMFDGRDYASKNKLDTYELGQLMQDEALEIIGVESTGYAYDYAMAFLNQVNWYEIAGHQIENYRS